MTATAQADICSSTDAFRHEALLYAGQHEFVERTSTFIRDGVAAGEPVLVVVSAAKIDMLREELGDAARSVLFADMDSVGDNPARIIPAWHAFVADHLDGDVALRGIGEPISDSRATDVLVECQRHEHLLNLAFAGSPGWWLLCPYDVETLSDDVIAEARRSHPFTSEHGGSGESMEYLGDDFGAKPFDGELSDPPPDAGTAAFTGHTLGMLRRFVTEHAVRCGLGPTLTPDLLVAVNELATNSVVHGGGSGTCSLWAEPAAVVCEIQDGGSFDRPLAGREQPLTDVESGRGLWLANQLCDLVQIRSHPSGTTVRLHLRRR
jgi:anti-sigma regulatory factor (Ser/Thr protein kinase)